VLEYQTLELLTAVLAAAVGVMQQSIGLAASPDRHHQSVGDELGCHPGAHRPTNHTPGEQIDDGRDKEPAFRGPDIREVSDPFAVGSGGFKAAAENVGCDGARLPLPQIGRQAAPAWTCLERLQPHQSLNPM
jgi:hypothetical protein